MSDRKRQQRAAMIVGGAAVGGLAIIGLAIALSSGGGDDENAIDTRRTTTTSSSTTSSSTTSSSTTTTLITLPPTFATTPTTIVLPTLPPPTSPPTAPPTSPPTSPPTAAPTTTTTLSPQKQLSNAIATALNGGVAPDPGQSRLTSVHIPDPDDPDDQTRVRWKLIDTPPLTDPEQEAQSRQDAFYVLKAIKDANLPGANDIVIRGTLPNSPDEPKVIVRVALTRADLDAIDFTTRDPLTILDYPDCDSESPQPSPCVTLNPPLAPPTTTTSSSTTTTTS